MGGEQAASVLAQIRREARERAGKAVRGTGCPTDAMRVVVGEGRGGLQSANKTKVRARRTPLLFERTALGRRRYCSAGYTQVARSRPAACPGGASRSCMAARF